jgi:hypothetical protein
LEHVIPSKVKVKDCCDDFSIDLEATVTCPLLMVEAFFFNRPQGSSGNDDPLKRPLFVTTVPRGIFLPPQPVVKEIVAKPRHVYAFASRPRILDQHQRRELLFKQSSISNNQTQNQLFYRSNNLLNKNVRSFDSLLDSSRLSPDRTDDGTCKIEGVKLPRSR